MATTPASEWAPVREEVTLPSGKVAVLRSRFPAYLLMKSGALSKDMMEAFGAAQNGELGDPTIAVELMEVVTTAMFIEPQVVSEDPKYGKGQIGMDDLDPADLDFVLNRAFGGGPTDTFPGDGSGVVGGEDSADVADDSVRAVGDGAGDDGESGVEHAPSRPARKRKR